MAKILKIFDYQMRKIRKSIKQQREDFTKRHEQRRKETAEVLQKINDDRAEFERRWFKFLKGGKP